jgi:hypothetical protein
MTTDWERIKSHFEQTAQCHHKQKPLVQHEPGCTFIECSKCDDCKCRLNDGEGLKLTEFLAEWTDKFV